MNKIRVLITGAGGYIGGRLYSDLNQKYEVLGTYKNNKLFDELVQLDITNREDVQKVMKDFKPDVIIHCAAISSRKPCEENPELAQSVNILGTKILVEESKKINAKFIFCSSLATIAPTNVYGKTKQAGEEIVLDYKNGIVLRLSVAFGKSPYLGENRLFNKIRTDIHTKIPREYDSTWSFKMTYLGHLSEIIEEIIAKEIVQEKIIPVVTEGGTNIYKISKDIMKEFDLKPIELGGESTGQPEEIDFTIYKRLELPEYGYSDVIRKLVGEIRG